MMKMKFAVFYLLPVKGLRVEQYNMRKILDSAMNRAFICSSDLFVVMLINQ